MNEGLSLPPLVSEIGEGKVTWQSLEDIDYKTLGADSNMKCNAL